MEIENKLKAMGYELPKIVTPRANYVSVVLDGSVLYTSGMSCFVDGKPKYLGRLGAELSVEEGYDAAKISALNTLSIIKHEIGKLERINRIIKVMGFVNSTHDFSRHPEVINGASDLLSGLLDDKGKHVRSAVGANSLPLNIPVEIDMIIKIKFD